MTNTTKIGSNKREWIYQGSVEVVDNLYPYRKHYVEHYEDLTEDFYNHIFNRKDGEVFSIEKLSNYVTTDDDQNCFGRIIYSYLSKNTKETFVSSYKEIITNEKQSQLFWGFMDRFGYTCNLQTDIIENLRVKYNQLPSGSQLFEKGDA